MLVRLGQKLIAFHDRLRLKKDKKFTRLVAILPAGLTPNHVTMFRSLIVLAWFPYALFRPSLVQVFIYIFIYFLDLLDGAMARLRNQITREGEYLDHISDKFSNIAVLFVVYSLSYNELGFIRYFVYWDLCMAGVLIIEFFSRYRMLSFIRSPFEVIVKTGLWLLIAIRVIPLIINM